MNGAQHETSSKTLVAARFDPDRNIRMSSHSPDLPAAGYRIQSRLRSAPGRTYLAVPDVDQPRQLVLLDVHDFGYSAYVRGEAEELSYDGFIVHKGILSRRDTHDGRPLVISARTTAAVNFEQDSSKINYGPHALLIENLPWACKAQGAPLLPGLRYQQSWLRHRLAITGITRDGTVTIKAGPKRIHLKPGSEVKIGRAIGAWRSTVTIRNRGLFDNNKIQPSRWLSVKTR